ncbi:hypothetical protein LU276_06555 [Moraxella haemolytica]|uniref:hypothetical protein n=1 Tax=Moraxella haemolytica TaxID=2904119 RepID=UPI002543BCD4|nr:hypothetical protein [Moraxella sp. ZY171148]WII94685.1 hypothetical protein LU276_06555 [Moraxella sp. ZY171148]
MSDKPKDTLERLCDEFLEREKSYADVEWAKGISVGTNLFNRKDKLHIRVIVQREPFDDLEGQIND